MYVKNAFMGSAVMHHMTYMVIPMRLQPYWNILLIYGLYVIAWFFCLVYIYLCLNNWVVLNLGDGTKSPLIMACFPQNDINSLLFFFFWQPVYYLFDESEQSFPGRSKE